MIYELVKARAEQLAKSIAAVEVEAGIANGTISGWRTGSRPYAETLQKVAVVLDCTVDDLLPKAGTNEDHG